MKSNIQTYLAKEMENLWQILEFAISGVGLIERGLFIILAQRGGEGKERGLHRTFLLSIQYLSQHQSATILPKITHLFLHF